MSKLGGGATSGYRPVPLGAAPAPVPDVPDDPPAEPEPLVPIPPPVPEPMPVPALLPELLPDPPVPPPLIPPPPDAPPAAGAKNLRSSTRSPATSASEIRPRIVFPIASASRLRRRGFYSAMRRINSDLIMKRGKHSAEPRGKSESTDASAGIASRPWRSDEARLRSAKSKHPGCAQLDDAQMRDGVFMSCGGYCFVFLETYCGVYH